MRKIALAAAVAVCIPAWAAAQARLPDASDPAAAVPRPDYRSVFQDLPTGVEEEQLDWKKANADVAQFPRGHGDWLKWEGRNGARPARPDPAAAPAAPAPASAPAARPGHRHH